MASLSIAGIAMLKGTVILRFFADAVIAVAVKSSSTVAAAVVGMGNGRSGTDVDVRSHSQNKAYYGYRKKI